MDSSSLCYKDGPQLPPLNFTTTCITSGRYIIFYNERLDGVTYPAGYEIHFTLVELCELIVQGKTQVIRLMYILIIMFSTLLFNMKFKIETFLNVTFDFVAYFKLSFMFSITNFPSIHSY